MASATVKVWTVLVDGKTPGPAGDHTHIFRSKSEKVVRDFAKGKTCWGTAESVQVQCEDVPRHIAARWGI